MTAVRAAPLETAKFVAALYALCREDRRSQAIDLALDYLDELLIQGRDCDCDAALQSLDPTRLAPSVSVSILGITRKANHLPARRRFFELSFAHIAHVKGRAYARDLLNKYR